METTHEVPTGQTFSTEEPIYLGNVYPGYGELWDTINSTNIGALYREFYLFTSYDKANGWTFYPSYRTVNRLMIYNRALSEQEILENRKADIINFGE